MGVSESEASQSTRRISIPDLSARKLNSQHNDTQSYDNDTFPFSYLPLLPLRCSPLSRPLQNAPFCPNSAKVSVRASGQAQILSLEILNAFLPGHCFSKRLLYLNGLTHDNGSSCKPASRGRSHNHFHHLHYHDNCRSCRLCSMDHRRT